jgi:hypothetical protein
MEWYVQSGGKTGRGRDGPHFRLGPPPARIPASGATALGSCTNGARQAFGALIPQLKIAAIKRAFGSLSSNFASAAPTSSNFMCGLAARGFQRGDGAASRGRDTTFASEPERAFGLAVAVPAIAARHLQDRGRSACRRPLH